MNIMLSVDKKGRILVPSEVRQQLHIQDQVTAEVIEQGLRITPLRPIKDPPQASSYEVGPASPVKSS